LDLRKKRKTFCSMIEISSTSARGAKMNVNA
jgi:hypothetical protein